jgi:beta-galactosidase
LQGLKKYTDTGEPYYGYGGDFGDFPNAYNFVLDGLTFSNHEPAPGLIEYKMAIQPVRLVSGGVSEVRIVNRYDAITLDHLKCIWSVVRDGFKSDENEVSIPIGISPSQEATLQIPSLNHAYLQSESYLQLRFLLKESTIWGEAGHEVAWEQVQIVGPAKLPASISDLAQHPSIDLIGSTTLKITGQSSVWEIDLVSGLLSSWKKGSSELIHSGLVMDFYRALTDNDAPGPLTDHFSPSDGAEWRRKRLDQTSESLRSIEWGVEDGLAIVKITKRVAPTVLEWSFDTETTYIFSSTSLRLKVKGKPQGINMPKTLARIGLTMSLNSDLSTVSWFGRGPGESYSDKKLSQRFGNWRLSVKDLFTDYEYPQESANRTDVRWVEFGEGGNASLRASFGDQPGCSFMASHYTTKAIETSLHPYELHKKAVPEVVVRFDWQHHGLGTGSCGPRPTKQYILDIRSFEHELLLE